MVFVTTYIGIDFEMANNAKASICAYGLAFEDGSKESEIIALHPTMPLQERSRYHGISPEATAAGAHFLKLYERLASLPEDTILIAHDLRSERRALMAAYTLWNLPKLKLQWLDSLKIAQQMRGKNEKAGVATMAKIFGMAIRHHDPADDALVALEVIKRYGDMVRLNLVKG